MSLGEVAFQKERVMRRVLTLTVLLAGALVAAQAVRAQDGPPRRDGERGPRPLAQINDALSKLDLNDEQKTKINAAREEFGKEMRASFEANREKIQDLEKQMKAAREAKDEAKIKELEEQMAKLRPNFEAKTKEFIDQKIKPVLTDEQKKKFDEELAKARAPRPERPQALRAELLLNNAEKLGLTDEQKTKIEDLQKNFREAMGKVAGEGEENVKARRELVEKQQTDLKALLTDEQKEKVAKLLAEQGPRPPMNPGARLERVLESKDLALTDEQKTKIADLRKAFAESIKTAKEDERPALQKKLIDDIKSLLTAEQKTTFDKLMQPRREGPPPAEKKPEPAPAPPL
jgi:Spy/CpxP family protein refolding chaperone